MIDKSTIDNRKIPDAVMNQVIPLVNKLEERIEALERKDVSRPEAPAQTPLPAEMPYDDLLKEAGFEFLEDLPSNKAQIIGVGPKRAKEINDWIEAQ